MSEQIDNIDDEDYDDFDEGDYGFIISASGELKSIMYPEDLFNDPPAEVKRICKIFGIKNLHMFETRTLH